MKRIATVLMLVMLAILAACEKETVLTVEQTSISIPDAGGSQTVSLTANKPWTVSTNQSWCKVSPSGGEEAASSRVTITCDANTSYDERNCTVTFTCAELTKTVSVTQATNNGLLVSQTSYELTKAAQQLNIEVKANVKFSVEIDADCKDWITYNTTKGLTTNMVVLDIAENKSYDGREGKVTIKQNGGNLSSTITIKQSQLDGLFISTPEYNLSNEKHTLTVEVSTNVEFDVTSEADWVKYVQTKGLNSKQIILEVDENDTYDQRETTVSVKQKNGSLSGTIKIKQDEKYGILVAQSEYNLSNEAQTIDVEVKYNVDFDVVIPSGCKDWITQVSTKGLNSKTYSFSIAKNTTFDNRKGSITFKEKNGARSSTISFIQEPIIVLEVTQKEYNIDIGDYTLEIDVTSNMDYTVCIDDEALSWLSLVETKGVTKGKVYIAVSPGDDNTDRTGQVTISYRDLTHIITIHQYSFYSNAIIQFADEFIKANLVEAYDVNGDDELSIKEARAVSSMIVFDVNTKRNCRSFDEFQLFTGVSTIDFLSFAYCEKLTSIILPNSIREIKSWAFEDCFSLSHIYIPDSVKVIGEGAFHTCKNLTSIVIPNGVTLIEANTFCECRQLDSIIIPDSVIQIGHGAFRECTNLSTIVIPPGVTIIGAEAFSHCSNLTSVIIPESINTIEHHTFADCKKMDSIIIPRGIKTIGNCAFENCFNLKKVIVMAITPPHVDKGTFSNTNNSLVINVPSESVDAYKTAPGWSEYASRIQAIPQ